MRAELACAGVMSALSAVPCSGLGSNLKLSTSAATSLLSAATLACAVQIVCLSAYAVCVRGKGRGWGA